MRKVTCVEIMFRRRKKKRKPNPLQKRRSQKNRKNERLKRTLKSHQ